MKVITTLAVLMQAAILSAAEPKKENSGIAPLNQTRDALEDYGQHDEDESGKDRRGHACMSASEMHCPCPDWLAFHSP